MIPPANEEVVHALSRPSRCHGCDTKLEKGAIVKLTRHEEEKEAFCQKCAGLVGFELVPSGNAKITRLAKKYSSPYFIVMRWSELWKCYERQGLLALSAAVAQAKVEAATPATKK